MYEKYEPMKRFQTRIDAVRRIKRDGWSVDETANHYGFDRATIYRWLEKWFEHDYKGLGDGSRRPKKLYNPTSWETQLLIRSIRSQRGWCHQTIALYLREEKGIIISPSTIYRILKKNSLIKPIKKQPRRLQQVKRPFPVMPGTIVQVDTKWLLPRRSCYQYSFVDAASRFAFATLDENLTMNSASRALMQFVMPTKVDMIQTDNGLEFQELFQTTAKKLGYQTRFNRISSPEENGRVERFHRTIGEEFYQKISTTDIAKLQNQLDDYLHYYNYERPHLALDGKTPIKYIQKMSQMC